MHQYPALVVCLVFSICLVYYSIINTSIIYSSDFIS